MVETLEKLRREHVNFGLLLHQLEKQLNELKSGNPVDYPLVADVADYFTGYPGDIHHPKEDLLFERLDFCAPAAAENARRLLDHHENIGRLAQKFADETKAVQEGSEVPRETFIDTLEEFILVQRTHMRMEESLFFPLVELHLTDEDWNYVNTRVSDDLDPVFEARGIDRYKRLLQVLVTS